MRWPATSERARMALHLRDFRDWAAGEVDDLRRLLARARDAFIALRDEVVDARGEHDTLGERLDAIEARLGALETPPDC